jgi:hypothetical protein
LEEDKEKVATFCMKGTETQKPSPLLLVLEAEEKGILRLASLSLTFKVTAWLPLLPEFSAMASSRHKKRECKKTKRESKEQRKEIAHLWQRTPAEQLLFIGTKRSKNNGEEREMNLFETINVLLFVFVFFTLK